MRIVWTKFAIKDLDNAYDYIAAINLSAALDIIERIEKAVAALRLTPGIGSPGRGSGTRELVMTRTPFTVPYRIIEERIEILAVIHSAKRWPAEYGRQEISPEI